VSLPASIQSVFGIVGGPSVPGSVTAVEAWSEDELDAQIALESRRLEIVGKASWFGGFAGGFGGTHYLLKSFL